MDPVRQPGACRTILKYEYDRCAQVVETQQLLGVGSWIDRRNGEICFRLASRDQTCVADEDATEPDGRLFRYLGTLARPRYHVLWVQYYEGSSILLINAASGKRAFVDGVPIPSPDASYLAVGSADLDAGYNPNRLSLWLVRDDALEKVWSIEPTDWSPGPIRWVGRTTLQVLRTRVDPQTGEDITLDTVTVELEAGVWRLVESKQASNSR
jgi:hypothetical protein